MAFGKVDNVDIVADTCAVGCIVVIAEDMDHLELAGSNLCHIGQEVIGNTLGIFTDETADMSTDRIEIAEQHDAPLIISTPDIGQDALLHRFCLSIGIGRDPFGALFSNRHKGGIAVYSCRGGENDLLAAVLSHHITEGQRGVEIISIILDRHTGRLSDSLISCKMNHSVNFFLLEKSFQAFAVTNVLLVEFRPSACDLLDAVYDHLFGIIEIVSDNNIIACIQKLHHRVASDKSCSTCYQNCHTEYPAPYSFFANMKSMNIRQPLSFPL